MELQQVRYFVTLAKALNFTKAADLCGISQPALSKAVQKLEAELGGALIFRERQLTQLTDLGRHMLPSLEKTLASAQDVGLRASEYQQKSTEPLKIALAPTVSATLLADPLRRLADHFPHAEIEFTVVAEDGIDDALLNGIVSAALSVTNEQKRHDRIDRFDLFYETLQVLSATSASLERDIVCMDALPDLTWVEMTENDLTQKVWDAYGLQSWTRRVRVRSDDTAHLHSMVVAGLGSMVVPQHAPAAAGTIKRPIEGETATRQIEIRVVAGRKYPPMLAAFVKLVRVFDWHSVVETPIVFASGDRRRLLPAPGRQRNDGASSEAITQVASRLECRKAHSTRNAKVA